MISIEYAAEIVLAQLKGKAKETEIEIIAKALKLGFNQEEAEDIAEKILWLNLG